MGRADEKFPYDDIIDLPRPVSKTRAQMSMLDRAAQFSPFAALTGYEAAIQETARLTDAQIEMEEDRKAVLDRKLSVLAEKLAQQPEVTITYFLPDEKKDGGAYVTISGGIKRIDGVERMILLTNGTKIPIMHVMELESSVFPHLAE